MIPPTGDHTCTAILIHGNYGDCTDWHGGDPDLPGGVKDVVKVVDCVKELGGSTSGIKFIYLNAPKRTLHWRPFTPGEQDEKFEDDVSTWYDYFSFKLAAGSYDFDDINENQLKDATDQIHAIIRQEASQLGDSRRVIIGGNSQGGTVAGHVACTYESTFGEPLGGLIFMRTILIGQTPVHKVSTPVFVFLDEYDTEYPPHSQHKAYQRLKDAGAAVTIHLEEKCDHYMNSNAELYWCAKWIALCGNREDLTVSWRDADNLPEDAMAHNDDIADIMKDVSAYHVKQKAEEAAEKNAEKNAENPAGTSQVRQQWADKNLKPILTPMVHDVLKNMPQDPKSYMAQWLFNMMQDRSSVLDANPDNAVASLVARTSIQSSVDLF